MGQKTHPIGLRLGIIKDWNSKWFANKSEYKIFLHEDLKIRGYIKKKLMHASIAAVDIERTANKVSIIIHTARPGIIIGKKGSEVEVLKKELGPNVRIIAVEPSKSPVLSGGKPGLHGIQGIGAGFVPDVLNREIIDDIIEVSDEDAYETSRKLMKNEGILCGISSGANFFAASKVALELGKEKKVVVIFPDSGERYLSTELFQSEKGTQYEGI